jgi:hypothetical protein
LPQRSAQDLQLICRGSLGKRKRDVGRG